MTSAGAAVAVAVAIVGPHAYVVAMTDGSEVHSDAANDGEATLDVDASGPAAIAATAANARIAGVAAVAAEKCRAGHIAATVAPNRSSSDDPNRSRDCWRNCRCCYYR